MNPDEIAKIIKGEINRQIKDSVNRTYLRGTITKAVDNKASVRLEGSYWSISDVICMESYFPHVNDKVLVLSIGTSGTNLVIMGLVNSGEDWHVVNAAGEPAYENSWVTHSAEYGDARFMRDSAGFVHLDGMVKSGTVALPIYKLPIGYRPEVRQLRGVNSSGGLARLDIKDSDGAVTHQSGGANGWVGLHGLIHKAIQSPAVVIVKESTYTVS